MKKILFLSIPILLPAILLVLFLLYANRQPPTWRLELEKYIAYKERGTSMLITEQAVERASKPWVFIRDSSYIVYGDTPYYSTDNTYQPEPAQSFGRMPLPYPPEELWCVLLKIEPVYAPGSPEFQMVFVARHQDLYNAGWVIHAAIQPPSSPEILRTLSHIGCDIYLGSPATPTSPCRHGDTQRTCKILKYIV